MIKNMYYKHMICIHVYKQCYMSITTIPNVFVINKTKFCNMYTLETFSGTDKVVCRLAKNAWSV